MRLVADVIRGFLGNRGPLLAGAVAFYMLLSSVPILILVFLAASTFVDEQQLAHMLQANLEAVFPQAVSAVRHKYSPASAAWSAG